MDEFNAVGRWLHDVKAPLTTAKLKAQLVQRCVRKMPIDGDRIGQTIRDLIAELDKVKVAFDKFPEARSDRPEQVVDRSE